MTNARFRRPAILLGVVALVLASGFTAAGRPAPTAADGPAIERGCHTREPVPCSPPAGVLRQASAEEQLAAQYAPIVYLRKQAGLCGQEAFQPMPVEIVLGNPDVTLVLPGANGRTLQAAPRAADLFRARAEQGAYLDLPGNPNRPRCTYAAGFQRSGEGTPAVTYAHIAREDGYLALQYWFYYYFKELQEQPNADEPLPPSSQHQSGEHRVL